MLCNKNDQGHVLTFASRKSRRVVRSIMAGEVYAFSQAFDAAFMIKHDLETIYCQKIPMLMLTDSKKRFDVITKATHTTERIMIDIGAAREAYGLGEISNLGLIFSEDNIADGLTKLKVCLSLHNMLGSGKSQIKVQQWIIRTGI